MKRVKAYVISIMIPLAIGGLSALLTRGNMNIFDEVKMPPLSPPPILFPIVWGILYVLMGISAAMIYNSQTSENKNKENALMYYALSLFFNFSWSIIFFNMRAFLVSFVWLIVLLALIIKYTVEYGKISRPAALLQIPYILWVCFAGYLNFGIWWLNR